MTDVIPEPSADLTADQEKILEDIFLYEDKAELTDADFETLLKMFETPDRFALLRRALQVFTPAERGLTIKSGAAFVEASPADVTRYAFEVAVDVRTDEKMRQTLVSLYRRIRQRVVENKRAEFEAGNKEAFEEGKRTAEYEEGKEADARQVGPNI